MNDDCVFCDIIAGKARASIVAATPDTMTFVPLSPVVDGHLLIVPRIHVSDFAENQWVSAEVMRHAAAYVKYEKETTERKSWNLITSMGEEATQSVQHLHIHLIPRTKDDQLMVPWGTVYGDDPKAPHWCKQAEEWRAKAEDLGAEISED